MIGVGFGGSSGRVFSIQGDGVTDTTTRIENALSKYKAVYIIGNHVTSSTITLTDGMQVFGSGKISNSTGDIFALNGQQIKIGGIELSATAGHVFNVTSFVSSSIFNIKATAESSTKSVWYQSGTASAYDNLIMGGEWASGASHSVPIFYVNVSDALYAANIISGIRFQTNGSPSAPCIELTCTASNWLYNNTVQDCNFEICDAGAIHLYGCGGTLIRNCAAFDVTTTTDNIWVLDNGGLNCYDTTMINVQRIGGTLGSSLYDINILGHYAGGIIIDNCAGTSAGGVTHRLPSAVTPRGGTWVTIDTY